MGMGVDTFEVKLLTWIYWAPDYKSAEQVLEVFHHGALRLFKE